MKILKIILFFCLFSTISFASAKDGYIETLMEFGEGPEAFEINTIEVQNLTFTNSALQKKYDDYVKATQTLKTALITEYANGNLEYYQVQGLIKNYNNFVYHSNKFFYYLSEKEKYPELRELTDAISRNYKLSRTYFMKIK